MTSAYAVGVTAMCLALAFFTFLALWMAFGDFRATHAERLDRQAAKLVHQARHDYVAAVGATNQRGLDAPTGALEPAEIVRLLGRGR